MQRPVLWIHDAYDPIRKQHQEELLLSRELAAELAIKPGDIIDLYQPDSACSSHVLIQVSSFPFHHRPSRPLTLFLSTGGLCVQPPRIVNTFVGCLIQSSENTVFEWHLRGLSFAAHVPTDHACVLEYLFCDARLPPLLLRSLRGMYDCVACGRVLSTSS